MLVLTMLLSSILATTNVTITEPIDGETYDGDWLPLRAIVENENEVPDSVHYSLNGASVVQIPRLNTDWPTYMQNYQNHGYSESPAPHENTILWAAPVTGYEHEFPTPVVYEGVVYYPQNYGGDDLYALDAATGKIIWVYEGTGWTDDAVTIDNGILYTASDSLFCINAYTGEKIWSSSKGNMIGSTPIVVDGRVFCGNGNNVVCLDSADGTLIWTWDVGAYTASCLAFSQNRLFVAKTANGISAIDANDGSLLWENNDHWYFDSSPVVDGNHIYTCCMDGYAFAINAETGITEWSSTLAGEITATPALYQDRLYFATESNKTYYCLDALDGVPIWTSHYNHHGSSGAADGLVFFGTVLNTNPDTASVVALDMLTGTEVWRYRTSCNNNWGFQSSPSITDGVMYYACTDGYLYAFGTGLKYTYKEDYFYADVGSNELIVTSWDDGVAAAADTINFTVTQTGITLEPSRQLRLSADPNPFCGSTAISFELTESGPVALQVFDLTGRLILDLSDNIASQGINTIHWDGCSNSGEPVSSGLYLCRIECEGVVETTGLCVLK